MCVFNPLFCTNNPEHTISCLPVPFWHFNSFYTRLYNKSIYSQDSSIGAEFSHSFIYSTVACLSSIAKFYVPYRNAHTNRCVCVSLVERENFGILSVHKEELGFSFLLKKVGRNNSQQRSLRQDNAADGGTETTGILTFQRL